MCHLGFKIQISGLVQGVGFRPFVFQIAKKQKLKGEVYNDTNGVVIILLCDKNKLEIFLNILKSNLPPLAKIENINISNISNKKYTNFQITTSKNSIKTAQILSDFAICDKCKDEFNDDKNPRFMYPFITCTHCGPRFSIIKDVPYDRKNTSMDIIKMCKFCESQYTNPLDRRFHAQPISCFDCAIQIKLKDKNNKLISKNQDAFKELAKKLKNGHIIAIKGMGGFHLVCDALNPKAIQTLRNRKNRPKKSLALMCEDLEQAKKLAFINKTEEELLNSNLKPIVLLKSKIKLDDISPDSNNIGIMLAYTPLHLCIFKYFKNPIIATSANISGESIIYDINSLYNKLNHVFDYMLDYERDIVNSNDDSIAQVINDKIMFLRSSRGINPYYIETKYFKNDKTILALGSELKNQFAIYYKNKILISPYIGDLKNIDPYERFFKLLDFFKKSYKLNFNIILCDKHPNFNYIKQFKRYKNIKIQHHFAHACAVMFENKIFDKNCLVFVFDGTGFGDDGAIWGGEIMMTNLKKYKRIAHFKEFKLINIDIKNIKNLALSIILEYNLENEAKEFLNTYDKDILNNLKKIHNNSKLICTSLGRIIDAFGAIVFNINKLDYEAQIGLMIEKYYDKNINNAYEFKIINNKIDFKEVFIKALKDDKNIACTSFLNGLVNLIIKISKNRIPILCGGVFQNKTLLEILDKKGFEYKTGLKFLVNDSSIALGQLAHFLAIDNK